MNLHVDQIAFNTASFDWAVYLSDKSGEQHKIQISYEAAQILIRAMKKYTTDFVKSTEVLYYVAVDQE